MNKLLPICLLLICSLAVTLSRASFSQGNAAKDQVEYEVAIKSAMEAARKRAIYQAMMKKSYDDDMPVVDEANFSIGIESKEKRITEGDPIGIDITLKNNGVGSPRLVQYPVETFYGIQVINQFGAVDSLPSRYLRRYAGSIGSYLLPKGRSLSGSVILSRLFDMSLAGSYQVKVSKQFLLKGNKNPVTIISNVLNIEVTSDASLSKWHVN